MHSIADPQEIFKNLGEIILKNSNGNIQELMTKMTLQLYEAQWIPDSLNNRNSHLNTSTTENQERS